MPSPIRHMVSWLWCVIVAHMAIRILVPTCREGCTGSVVRSTVAGAFQKAPGSAPRCSWTRQESTLKVLVADRGARLSWPAGSATMSRSSTRALGRARGAGSKSPASGRVPSSRASGWSRGAPPPRAGSRRRGGRSGATRQGSRAEASSSNWDVLEVTLVPTHYPAPGGATAADDLRAEGVGDPLGAAERSERRAACPSAERLDGLRVPRTRARRRRRGERRRRSRGRGGAAGERKTRPGPGPAACWRWALWDHRRQSTSRGLTGHGRRAVSWSWVSQPTQSAMIS